MIVDVPGVGKYRVKWHHRVDDDSRPTCTECVILGDDGGVIEVAVARCNPKDHFERNRGRKLSLTRALEQWTPVRDYRRYFWNAYREQLGHY